MKRVFLILLLACPLFGQKVLPSFGSHRAPSGGGGGSSLLLATTSLQPTWSGSTYSQTLSATLGSGSGYTYAVTSGSLPTGISLSSSGVFSGSSTVEGYYPLSIRVTDSASNTMTRKYWITVSPALDVYGGINSVSVSGCTAGYFQIKLQGTHWLWADPNCKAFPQRTVYNAQGYIDAAVYTAKFGGNYNNWYNNQIFPMFAQTLMNGLDIYSRTPSTNYVHALFWNTIGDLYNGNRGCPNQILPNDTGCNFGTVPGGATPAPLFICDGQDSHGIDCGSGYLTYDVFNPNWALASYNGTSDSTHRDELYLMKSAHSNFNTDPYILYISLGDATYLDTLAGPGVPAISGVSNYPDPAATVAMSNFHFVETSSGTCSSGSTASNCGWPTGGAPQDLWSKYAWTCGKTGVDFGWGTGVSYLQHTYANIAALNTAWGSSYTSFCDDGGFNGGTGVLDEDGRGSWFGSDPAYAQTGMNANLKVDLANFLQKFAYVAYYTQLAAVKVYDTNHAIGVGSYGGAGDGGVRTAVTKGITQAGIDLWIWNWNSFHSDQAAAVNAAEYDDTCAAGKCTPGAVWYGVIADGDSTFYECWNGTHTDGWGANCHPWDNSDVTCTAVSTPGAGCTGADPGKGGQESRGAYYAVDIPKMWNSAGSDGNYWNLGTAFWELSDNTSEGANWGLESYEANPYNGNSATALGGVSSTGLAEGEVADASMKSGYPYTPPTVGFGNFLGAVAQTNLGIMMGLETH